MQETTQPSQLESAAWVKEIMTISRVIKVLPEPLGRRATQAANGITDGNSKIPLPRHLLHPHSVECRVCVSLANVARVCLHECQRTSREKEREQEIEKEKEREERDARGPRRSSARKRSFPLSEVIPYFSHAVLPSLSSLCSGGCLSSLTSCRASHPDSRSPFLSSPATASPASFCLLLLTATVSLLPLLRSLYLRIASVSRLTVMSSSRLTGSVPR